MVNILNLKEKDKKKAMSIKRKKKKVKDSLVWSAPEFNYYRKEKTWFMITGLIAAGLFTWAFLTKNILFALLIGLGYFSLIAYTLKKPKKVRLSITPRGINIGYRFYEFDSLRSFWIFYDPPEIKELSLRSKKVIMPYIKIPLGNQNPVKIRKALLDYLPEKKQQESLIESLARRFRF